MTSHPLDQPVWQSLTTHQGDLGIGSELARRFRPDINLFADMGENSPEAEDQLRSLVRPGDQIFLVNAAPIRPPTGFDIELTATAVQMIAQGAIAPPDRTDDILTLGDHDAPEMLALATLTKPGPFLRNTHKMGHFQGVRIDGRLAAMAGERMRFPGYTEVSGVCVHPDFRGAGLARRLSRQVANAIGARGEIPFLHAWEDNKAAITLYETLGFQLRTNMNIVVARLTGDK